MQSSDDGPDLQGSSALFEEGFRESWLDIFSLAPLCSSIAEEILDDGVGLILETSGDSLDDDSEIFSESDDFGKVRNSKHIATFALTRKDKCTHHGQNVITWDYPWQCLNEQIRIASLS